MMNRLESAVLLDSLRPIPIIDLFAGPGGLGEGFSAVQTPAGSPAFEVKVSVEKDEIAHRTLSLRAFFRAFGKDKAPDAYYDYVRGTISRADLFRDRRFANEVERSKEEAKCATLGQAAHKQTDAWIRKALGNDETWVLIGGPPCQAYSLAGRSRRTKETLASFEKDEKHFLYTEYLRIIQNFRPPVFVMENVKGMLSSKHGGSSIFDRILGDLSKPADDLEYEIRSFVVPHRSGTLEPMDFVIKAEDFGIPQMRHRVILLGVRKDHAALQHKPLRRIPTPVTVRDVLAGLPMIRSRISKEPDFHDTWLGALRQTRKHLTGLERGMKPELDEKMVAAIAQSEYIFGTGQAFTISKGSGLGSMPAVLASWFGDTKLGGVSQHEARSHMRSDLHRYLYAACFAQNYGQSPNLRNFPEGLLPNHRNADADNIPFLDRFRVQIYSKPSTTVVSHIAKDGHYYIHPDPAQCRSLTVREAARLQTFPDNYFFEGNRTQQYTQVGNAVPPLLAHQLAEVVLDLLRRTEGASVDVGRYRAMHQAELSGIG